MATDFEVSEIGTGTRLSLLELQVAEIVRLRALVMMGTAVVEDFLPNIGRCALQDYGRLNDFLMASDKVKKAIDAEAAQRAE